MIDFLHNENVRFYIILSACIVLIYIPYIGKYVRLISTMIHEGGHVLMGLILGEKTVKVNLFSDASGEASVTISNKFKKFLIAAAGYPTTALMALCSFWLLSKGFNYYYVIGVLILTSLFLVFYIRNLFGVIWAISFIAGNGLLLYYQKITIIEILATAYACIIFLESVFSCFILVYISFTSSKILSDASNISSVIHLPKQLIALFFTAFNVYIAYVSVMNFFPDITKIFNI
ncbi:MAG: M50 family metallopeptidase [Bacteroidales bacterium]|nr:M50 family metallopeptidase [Bacteroidales bacterium]MDD4210507.1 M50 family metallopeptidase [Bacteroidales bacterium]